MSLLCKKPIPMPMGWQSMCYISRFDVCRLSRSEMEGNNRREPCSAAYRVTRFDICSHTVDWWRLMEKIYFLICSTNDPCSSPFLTAVAYSMNFLHLSWWSAFIQLPRFSQQKHVKWTQQIIRKGSLLPQEPGWSILASTPKGVGSVYFLNFRRRGCDFEAKCTVQFSCRLFSTRYRTVTCALLPFDSENK